MAKHHRPKKTGVGGPKPTKKKSSGDNQTQNKAEAFGKSLPSSQIPRNTSTVAALTKAKPLNHIDILEKYISLAKQEDKILAQHNTPSSVFSRAKPDISAVPMEYRAQVNGRCQRQYFNVNVEGKLKDHAHGSQRPAACHWIDEWQRFAAKQIPFTISGLNLLPDDQPIHIDWRLISNSGIDEGFIRPVIAAGGWPLVPGSSIKGLFRRACKEIAPQKVMAWCGGEATDGEIQPGLLRFHGAWPADGEWKKQLLDVAHPQQQWQVGINQDKHNANAVASLYQPRLNIVVSSTDPYLKEEEWKEIRSVMQHALGKGIGGRTCAGYGSSGCANQALLFECSLHGQGPASKLLDGSAEFRPNMFRAAIRGMALRLFGGITDAKTARKAVGSIFGSIDPEDGEGACVGMVASSFLSDSVGRSPIMPFRSRQYAYKVVGKLQWRLVNTPANSDIVELRQIIEILHGLTMTLGGFGRSWRRPDHRIFFPEYYTERERRDSPPQLIGCHWQWSDFTPLPSLLRVQTPEGIRCLLQRARSLAQQWIGKNASSLGKASAWREIIHPNHLFIWTREAKDRDDAAAIHWFHKRPEDDYKGRYPLKLKGTPLAGFVGKKEQVVGHIWNRLLPLRPEVNSVEHQDQTNPTQIGSRNEAFRRPAYNLSRIKSSSISRQADARKTEGRAAYDPLEKIHQGPFLEIVSLNVPDSRRQEFQSFIQEMDDGADSDFQRLQW